MNEEINNMLKGLERLFPYAQNEILRIVRKTSVEEQKQAVVDFLDKQVKILKTHASNAKIRAAISDLRVIRRKFLSDKNKSKTWYKDFISAIVKRGIISNIAQVVTKTLEPVIDSFTIPGFGKVVSAIAYYCIAKPVDACFNWTVDTIKEGVDVVRETVREAKEQGKGKIKTALLTMKEVGKFVFHKTADSVVSLVHKTKSAIVATSTIVINAIGKVKDKVKTLAGKVKDKLKDVFR